MKLTLAKLGRTVPISLVLSSSAACESTSPGSDGIEQPAKSSTRTAEQAQSVKDGPVCGRYRYELEQGLTQTEFGAELVNL